MTKRLLCCLLVTLFFASPVQARRWTDKQGRTMDAEFVRVSGTTVTFNRNGEEVGVEMADLSDRDQRFIRRLVRSQQKKNGVKPATRSSKKITKRVWRDDQGNRTEAKFVRVHIDNVILIRGGRTITLPFWKLSKADQQYVAGILKDLGQEVPPAEKPAPPKRPGADGGIGGANGGGANMGGANMGGGRFAGGGMPGGGFARGGGLPAGFGRSRGSGLPGAAGRGGAPFGGGGAIPGQAGNLAESVRARIQRSMAESRQRLEESRRRMDEQRRKSDEQFKELNRSLTDNSSAESQANRALNELNDASRRHQAQTQDLGNANRAADEAMNSAQQSVDDIIQNMTKSDSPPAGSQQNNSPAAVPTFQTGKACGTCGKEVSSSLQAGDSCPHCGAYFDYEEDAAGNRKWANGRGWMFGGGIAGVVTILGVMIRMIVAWARS